MTHPGVTSLSALSLVVLIAAGCGDAGGPKYGISDLRILAPLPGTSAAVAYFSVTNSGDDSLEVVRVTSPEFGRAELHESTVTDGVVRMHALDSLSVPPGKTVALREGGVHVMLLEPHEPLTLDSAVTLVLTEAGGGETVLRSTLEPRVVLDDESR